MTSPQPDPRLEAATDAAMTAVIAWQKQAREALWASPSRNQVRATIRAQFDRAEAAERRARELEAAMERHTHSFADPRGIVLCGGCLEPAPCPDSGLIGKQS